MKLLAIVIGILVLASALASANEGSMRLELSKDIYIDKASPNSSFNTPDLYMKPASATTRRILGQFNLSQLPANISVSKATMFIYADSYADSVDRMVQVQRVGTDSWSEQATTWNNAPAADSAALNSTIVGPAFEWYAFDVTPLAGETDKIASFQMKFVLENLTDSNPVKRFRSREYVGSEFQPYVLINYTGNGPHITGYKFPLAASQGQQVALNFSASDADNNIQSYTIHLNGRVIANTSHATLTLDYETPATSYVTYTVNDTSGFTDQATAQFAVSPETHLVINEFSTEQQWIELYNPLPSPLDLAGWTIEDNTGATFGGNKTASLSGTVQPGAYLVLNRSSEFNFTLTAGCDIIMLRNQGLLADKVAYGTFVYSNPADNAPSPPAGQTAGRYPNGIDTQIDSVDFTLMAATPGAANQLSNVTPPVDTVAPNATLASISFSNGNAKLDWQAPYGGADGYNIYRSTSPTGFNYSLPAATTAALSWTDSASSTGQASYYVVRAYRATLEENSTNILAWMPVQLSSGWNLFSTPLNLTSMQLGQESILGNPLPVLPANSIKAIYRYSAPAFEYTTHFDDWGYFASGSSAAFTAIEPSRGYWLYANQTCTAVLTGKPYASQPILLASGWNMIGHAALSAAAIGEESIVGNPVVSLPSHIVRSIYRYNAEKFEFTTYFDGYGFFASGSSSAFTSLEPSVGYWAYTNQTGTLTNS